MPIVPAVYLMRRKFLMKNVLDFQIVLCFLGILKQRPLQGKLSLIPHFHSKASASDTDFAFLLLVSFSLTSHNSFYKFLHSTGIFDVRGHQLATFPRGKKYTYYISIDINPFLFLEAVGPIKVYNIFNKRLIGNFFVFIRMNFFFFQCLEGKEFEWLISVTSVWTMSENYHSGYWIYPLH